MSKTVEEVKAELIDVFRDISTDIEVGALYNPVQVGLKQYAGLLADGRYPPEYVLGLGKVIRDTLMEVYGEQTVAVFLYLHLNQDKILSDGGKMPQGIETEEMKLVLRLAKEREAKEAIKPPDAFVD